MAYKKIGVIGGMGPTASAEFYKLIVEMCQKQCGAIQDSDYPHIIINSVPFSSSDEKGIKDETKFILQLEEELDVLKKCGCELVASPCNSISPHMKMICEKKQMVFVDLIEECINKIKKHNNTGLLASQTTIKNHHYQNASNQDFIIPTSGEQKIIDQAILKVMGGTHTESDSKKLARISDRMKEEGANCILLACTELPIVFSNESCPLPVYNSTQILAEATINNSKSLK